VLGRILVPLEVRIGIARAAAQDGGIGGLAVADGPAGSIAKPPVYPTSMCDVSIRSCRVIE